MKLNEFIVACKKVGVNIKSVLVREKNTIVTYNYDLSDVKVSQTYKATCTQTDNDLQTIFNDKFADVKDYVRF